MREKKTARRELHSVGGWQKTEAANEKVSFLRKKPLKKCAFLVSIGGIHNVKKRFKFWLIFVHTVHFWTIFSTKFTLFHFCFLTPFLTSLLLCHQKTSFCGHWGQRRKYVEKRALKITSKKCAKMSLFCFIGLETRSAKSTAVKNYKKSTKKSPKNHSKMMFLKGFGAAFFHL